ncbi:MAG: Glutamate synthase [NADPH] large chain [Cytophagales bacterium]|jgi:CDGSH-type Zn-finger protein|nr:CDGSH iron-sulfur domain-containing protein [Bacteroidota bacterium]MBS1981831.1 CDGSH iron-sulfur domain-containing protein [Bacteroidota bacterium]WHZ07451.1 MAG: Glutamate synthase [NADPH] large chain [Cytophagales bacterium]
MLGELTSSTAGPVQVELQPGKTYSWCQCGRSKNQPFCDTVSHIGTGIEPKEFSVLTARKVWLCMCKHTKMIPYCDGTHNKLNKK